MSWIWIFARKYSLNYCHWLLKLHLQRFLLWEIQFVRIDCWLISITLASLSSLDCCFTWNLTQIYLFNQLLQFQIGRFHWECHQTKLMIKLLCLFHRLISLVREDNLQYVRTNLSCQEEYQEFMLSIQVLFNNRLVLTLFFVVTKSLSISREVS